MKLDDYIGEQIVLKDKRVLFDDKPKNIIDHYKMCKCNDCKKYFLEE